MKFNECGGFAGSLGCGAAQCEYVYSRTTEEAERGCCKTMMMTGGVIHCSLCVEGRDYSTRASGVSPFCFIGAYNTGGVSRDLNKKKAYDAARRDATRCYSLAICIVNVHVEAATTNST